MCRLLAVISSEPVEYRVVLRHAPRSLALLSQQHPHGWGVAIFDPASGWGLRKSIAPAYECPDFHDVAVSSRGVLMLAHIRQRTVGTTCLENTHPFHQGRWMFAHNGTIEDRDYLRSAVSPARLAAVRGLTDSELLFAYILTKLDDAGVGENANSDAVAKVLRRVVAEWAERPSFGARNFLLSDGSTTFAHRAGRSLYFLERLPEDEVRTSRTSAETGAVIETPWSQRRHAVLIASEAMTDEPWQAVEEGTLLRVERTPYVRWTTHP